MGLADGLQSAGIGDAVHWWVVWDLGDVGIGLMTIFNLIALYPLSKEAIQGLREYEQKKSSGVMSRDK